MCTSRRGAVVGMLAGLFVLGNRPVLPQLVDESGHPFRLRFRSLGVELSRGTMLRSEVFFGQWPSLEAGWLDWPRPWSLPDVISGRTEPEGSLLIDERPQHRGPRVRARRLRFQEDGRLHELF